MAVGNVYLKGGPCDGRTVSANQIVGGLVAYIKCGGGYYILDDGVTRPNGDIVFKYSGASPPQPPGGDGVKAPRAHQGWHDLRHSLNTKWPHALRDSERLTRAALRSIGRARRVRL